MGTSFGVIYVTVTNKPLGFPGGSDGKEFACKAGDVGLIPGLERSPGGGGGNSLQYSCLQNPHSQGSQRVRHD